MSSLRGGPPAWLQVAPFAAVFLFFFVAPLVLVGAVSLWPSSEYELVPGFTLSGIPAGVSGLGLVRSLLPRKGAKMSLDADGPEVVARLELTPPAVTVLEPL